MAMKIIPFLPLLFDEQVTQFAIFSLSLSLSLSLFLSSCSLSFIYFSVRSIAISFYNEDRITPDTQR